MPAPYGSALLWDSGIRRRSPLRPEIVALVGLLLIVQGYPLFLIIASAFNVGDPQAIPSATLGFANFVELTHHLDWIGNTLIVAFGGTVLATTIGVVLAWTLHRAAIPGSGLLETLISIPYPLGPLVGALAWNALGSPEAGVLNKLFTGLTGIQGPLVNVTSVPGIIFVMGIFEAPVAVLMIGAAMQRMDPTLEECSAIFGAGRVRTALRVTIPLMRPAILSAALFVFSSMLGAFAIPAVLGVNSRFYVATTAIFVLFEGYPPNYPLAAAIGLVLIAITIVAVWLYVRTLRGHSYVVVSGKTYRPRRVNLGVWKPVALSLAWLYVLLALILPLGVLVVASFQTSSHITWKLSGWTLQNYKYVIFDYPITRQAIGTSLLLGLGTGTVGVVLATVIAWLVHRRKGPSSVLLEQVTMLPQAFPRLIFGFGFLWMVLSLPIHAYGTPIAVLAAYVIVFLPLAYRSMAGVVVQVDRSLEEAARMSGAAWRRIMRTVTLPLLRSGLLATWVLLFMVSVREVSASLFLTGPNTRVLGPALFSFWDSGGLPRVSTLAVVQAVIILIALLIVRWIARASPVGGGVRV